MLSPEAVAHRETQRKALRDYLAGPRQGALVLERHEEYCIDDVLYPTLYSRLRLMGRYIVLGLAERAPFCPVKIAIYRLLGVTISPGSCIAPGVMLDPIFPELITLDGCCLGIGSRVLTHEYTVASFRVGAVHIGKDSVIGGFSTVRSGVRIGRRVNVGANSFVNKDVPDGLTVGGVPARPLKLTAEAPTQSVRGTNARE